MESTVTGIRFEARGNTFCLAGGAHRTGENHGGKYDDLRAVARQLYPQSQRGGVLVGTGLCYS